MSCIRRCSVIQMHMICIFSSSDIANRSSRWSQQACQQDRQDSGNHGRGSQRPGWNALTMKANSASPSARRIMCESHRWFVIIKPSAKGSSLGSPPSQPKETCSCTSPTKTNMSFVILRPSKLLTRSKDASTGLRARFIDQLLARLCAMMLRIEPWSQRNC